MAMIASRKWLRAFILSVAVLSGCHGNGRLDLLDSPTPIPADSDERERLKQLQLVQITPVDATGKELPTRSVEASLLAHVFEQSCDFSAATPSGKCLVSAFRGQQQLCVAHQLLAAIQPTAGIDIVDTQLLLPTDADATSWILKAQSTATNVALARAAKLRATQALGDFEEGLAQSMGGGIDLPEMTLGAATTACPISELDGVSTDPSIKKFLGDETLRQGLASYFIEAY
jgi:hypothetical protein